MTDANDSLLVCDAFRSKSERNIYFFIFNFKKNTNLVLTFTNKVAGATLNFIPAVNPRAGSCSEIF